MWRWAMYGNALCTGIFKLSTWLAHKAKVNGFLIVAHISNQNLKYSIKCLQGIWTTNGPLFCARYEFEDICILLRHK